MTLVQTILADENAVPANAGPSADALDLKASANATGTTESNSPLCGGCMK